MNAAIKIDPTRLPAPKLPPTIAVRVDPVPAWVEEREIKMACSKRPGPTKSETSVLIDLYRQGKTFAEIGREMGVAKGTIAKRIDKLRHAGELEYRPKVHGGGPKKGTKYKPRRKEATA